MYLWMNRKAIVYLFTNYIQMGGRKKDAVINVQIFNEQRTMYD